LIRKDLTSGSFRATFGILSLLRERKRKRKRKRKKKRKRKRKRKRKKRTMDNEQ
jgi:hypothetical protein